MFFVSQGEGGAGSHNITVQDAVFGNGGNDSVTFTDSDYLWWRGNLEDSLLLKNTYSIERGPGDDSSDISNLILQAGSPSARNAIGNDDSKGNYGQGSNYIVGNEFDNILDGGGVGGSLGLGTGVDVLIGGSGKDNFVVSGYTNSTSNEWAPSIIDYTEGPLAGKSVWISIDSVYTDADYVVVDDFEAGDNLELLGNASDYWIGAPVGDDIPPSFGSQNIAPFFGGPESLAKSFGIYTAGTPNLIAVVNLVGGLELDTLTLQLAFDPAPSNTVPTNSSFRNVLGWGTFWRLEGSSFAEYVNQPYVAADSFADLTSLVRSGDDTFIGGPLDDFYNGFGGNDSLLGGGGNDTLLGGPGNDSLFGEAGNDSLLGGEGADYLDGGIGDDIMIGGTGNDTYIVDSLVDTVLELPNEGTDKVISFVSGYELPANVEDLELAGLAVTGSGNVLDNRIFGNDLDNVLDGVAGNNTLDGGGGSNILRSGNGDDVYIVRSIDDIILDGGGVDTILSSVSFDLTNPNVNGGTGIEHLTYTGTASVSLLGNDLSNSIRGGAGDDTLEGRGGTNTLVGGFGDDFYILQANSTDFIVDTAGTDTVLVNGSLNLSTMAGGSNIENLLLTSSSGATLTGNTLDNLIRGNLGNDFLSGEAGNDTLIGTSATGLGEIDTLIGGAGADLFVLGTASSVFYNGPGASDYALIRDFNVEQGDQLQLNNRSTYLFGANNIFGPGIGGANSYLYNDINLDGEIDAGDRLIVAISATGGAGEDKNLIASDLAKIVVYV
jgi:Ca2+-binding RTX toxin-like protein